MRMYACICAYVYFLIFLSFSVGNQNLLEVLDFSNVEESKVISQSPQGAYFYLFDIHSHFVF